ncbi:MAG: DUF4118 domain-containing protein [Bacillota bacterium]|nr:DUF4118 domain-containing protein [Bacillota bacterium]
MESYDNEQTNRASNKNVNSRFLVCIGPSPSSAKCIQWAARAAEAFSSPWTVLFVETPGEEYYSKQDNDNIQKNLELAAKLGGQITVLPGYDVAATIAEYAKLTGITNIVIGKSRKRKNIINFFEKNLEDKLLLLLSDIEIYILPDNSIKTYRKTKLSNLLKNLYFSWIDTFKTVVTLVITTLLSLALREIGLGDQNVMLLYILSVLIVSRITSGYIYGVIVSLLSVLLLNFLFIKPYYTFNITQQGYPLTLLIMLLVAFITSALMLRMKAQAKNAVSRERKTEGLYEINKKLLATRGLENIINLTNDYISKLFDRSVVFYSSDPENGGKGILTQSEKDPDASALLNSDEEKKAVHWIFMNKKRAGAGTDAFTSAQALYMPILSQGNVLGVFGISCLNGLKLSHENSVYLRVISSLVAMALERQHLSDEQRTIIIESEKEKMRSNLLRAISHDLRTPLTAILGASSAILENKDIGLQTHNKLVSGIKEDSQWLIRMVENLLSVTRINESSMNVKKSPEAVEEIVAESVLRVKSKFKDCNIKVSVPDDLLIVPMDGTLIEQVIINLLENAIKHTPENSMIELTVSKSGNSAVFQVSDSGKGISEQDLPYIFEGYTAKNNPDSTRGMGIGLSICRTIVTAHGGKIEAENKAGSGAIFRFILPIEENKFNE